MQTKAAGINWASVASNVDGHVSAALNRGDKSQGLPNKLRGYTDLLVAAIASQSVPGCDTSRAVRREQLSSAVQLGVAASGVGTANVAFDTGLVVSGMFDSFKMVGIQREQGELAALNAQIAVAQKILA
jgi:hypothetical protein